MCGIAGIVRTTPSGEAARGIPDEWVRTLDERIAWRGPDDAGLFYDFAHTAEGQTIEVLLIHRRLAIIDLEDGAQPMVSEVGGGDGSADGGVDGEVDRLAVVFNGCLYNHRELRAALEDRGHRFVTDHSDTEPLLHLYRHRRGLVRSHRRVADDGAAGDAGDDALRKAERTLGVLEGMFAYAVWDRRAARVVLGRDRHGEKPLWISRRRDGVLVFASTIAAVEALHDVLGWDGVESLRGSNGAERGRGAADRLDVSACVDWFGLGWSSERGPQRGIVALGPGEELVIEAEREEALGPLRSFALALLILPFAIPVLVVAATLLVLVGGVIWLGAALPYLLILLLPLPASVVLRAFGKPSPRKLVQREVELVNTADRLINEAVRGMLEADVPLGLFLSGGVDSSLVTHYACRHAGALPAFCVRMPDEAYDESSYARMAAEVCGADLHLIDPPTDVLGDLERLVALIGAPFADSSLLPSWWLCRGASEHVKVALSGDGGDELFLGYERQRVAGMLHWAGPLIALLPTRLFDRSDPKSRSAKIARLIEASRGAGYVDLVAVFPAPMRRRLLGGPWRGALAAGEEPLQAHAFDRLHYLAGDLMLKTDTAGMAAHLEVRAPLLHPSVSDFATGLPAKDAMLGGERKGLLRALARRHFDAALIDRPKMGFALPIGRWFREDYGGLRTTLHDAMSSARGFGEAGEVIGLRMDRVRAMVEEHQSGAADHGQRLFLLLTLALWARR